MIDPRNASVVYTPMDAKNAIHPTVGGLHIMPTADVHTALDEPQPAPHHEIVSRPPQRNSFAETTTVVPPGEGDPLRGAMLTALRLIALDGLPASYVLAAFGSHVAGFAELIPDGRVRERQRVV